MGARVIRQTGGVSAARNTAIAAASQPWIAFLDADDLWLPEKLALQWAALQRAAGTSVAYCDHTYFQSETGATVIQSKLAGEAHYAKMPRVRIDASSCVCGHEAFQEAVVIGLFAPPSALIIDRDTLLSIGMFDADLRRCGDWEMMLRVAAVSSAVGVELPLMRKRLHGTQITANLAAQYATYADITRRIIARPELNPPSALMQFERRTPMWLERAGKLYLRNGDIERAHEAFHKALTFGIAPGAAGGRALTLGMRAFGGRRLHAAVRAVYRRLRGRVTATG